MKKDENKKFKQAFKSLKLIDEFEKEQKDMKAETGIFSIQDAKDVIETGKTKTIISKKNGIPDKILNVKKAKKLLLQRNRIQDNQVMKTMEVISNVLEINNCKLETELVINDAWFGTISRMHANSPNGIVNLKIKQENINVINIL